MSQIKIYKSKKWSSFFVAIAVLISCIAMQRQAKRVIFFGDSITQAGVKGNGYINQLKKAVDSTKFQLIGAGIGGNKVYDLYLRLEEDVLNKKPDLVFIYVGINDVWHKLGARTGTDYDKYLKFYQALINKIQAKGSKVVLCTPTVIGEKKEGTNEVDADLNKYAAGVRDLAAKNNLPLCDLRKAFMDYEAANNTEDQEKGVLTTDKVHLNDVGNKLVADTMLPFIK
ncbi:Lysophospholipase L1 [Pedobacter insulae]|uniref:Lysophospholipase L1 n=2 Tax=Pedobacter insulae TaxID=414048 RepID=A0A1I2YWE4_9SPHI|nr:Lysophospholipase L1 [Pedobacter insulae]